MIAALTAAVFAFHPGWHTGATRPHPCSGVSAASCAQAESWAATVRWRDCADCVPPHRTLAVVPADGVAIHVTVGVERPARLARAVAWPPTVRAADVHAPLEGAPTRIGAWELSGHVGAVDVFVNVFFGRPHPSRAQLASAKAELARARLR